MVSQSEQLRGVADIAAMLPARVVGVSLVREVSVLLSSDGDPVPVSVLDMGPTAAAVAELLGAPEVEEAGGWSWWVWLFDGVRVRMTRTSVPPVSSVAG